MWEQSERSVWGFAQFKSYASLLERCRKVSRMGADLRYECNKKGWERQGKKIISQVCVSVYQMNTSIDSWHRKEGYWDKLSFRGLWIYLVEIQPKAKGAATEIRKQFRMDTWDRQHESFRDVKEQTCGMRGERWGRDNEQAAITIISSLGEKKKERKPFFLHMNLLPCFLLFFVPVSSF